MCVSSATTVDTNFEDGQPALLSRATCWRIALSVPFVVAPLWAAAWLNVAPSPLITVSGAILLMLLVVSSITDVRSRKIYNWATYTALGWALSLNVAQSVFSTANVALPVPIGGVGIVASLMGMGLCFLVVMFAYDLSGGGAGDVKLAAAIGALVGPQIGIFAVVYAYVFAGAAMLAVLTWERGPLSLLTAFGRWIGSNLTPGLIDSPSDEDRQILNRPVPLGPYFALGTLFALL